jgi:uncharacterized protein
MKISKVILKKIEKFAQSKVKNLDQWHNWSHAERTVKLAKYLAKKEQADESICIVSATLHDIGQSVGIENHNLTGAKLAEEFLKKIGFKKNFIDQAVHCIISHSSSHVKKAKTIEARVLFDADKLQTIGPFGVMRVLLSSIDQKIWHASDALKLAKQVEVNNYKNNLQTKTAKQLIKRSYQFMQKFYQLYDQWDKLENIWS